MKRIGLVILLSCVLGVFAFSQPLGNEWINYSKTYYKFKVGKTGLYRINQTTLQTAGLGAIPCEQFQLWRNGEQVSLRTSKASGVLTSGDYIEFVGYKNDGKFDKSLYRDANFQLNDAVSLYSDTAIYFLTVNTTTANNFRYTSISNTINNAATPETNFDYTHKVNFDNQITRGFYELVGRESVYSSSYDQGEGAASDLITSTTPYNFSVPNLYVDNASNVELTAGLGGQYQYTRTLGILVNNTLLMEQAVSGFVHDKYTKANIAPTSLLTSTNNFQVKITQNVNTSDAAIISSLAIKYKRKYNFGGASFFEFSLPVAASAKYLKIDNFNHANQAPILYNKTTKEYLQGVINGTYVEYNVPALTADNDFVLVSQTSFETVNSLQSKTFTDYTASQNQGNYLIVSNKAVTSGGTAAADYVNYRTSAAGGNFNVKLLDIDDITDQFAYGIKRHPLAIRNLLRFAKNNFAQAPEYILLAGRGVTYEQCKKNSTNPNVEKLNLIPTFGWPASDNLLVSETNMPNPICKVGRLSVLNNDELSDYLIKLKEHEAVVNNSSATLQNKLWQKQLVHVAGADDIGTNAAITSYLNQYAQIAKDTLFGANIATFTKTGGSAVTPTTVADMGRYFDQGINLITYFGHSASSSLSYNLNNPYDYSNEGKYPVMLVNGCNAGNFFDFDELRFLYKSAISEKFVLAQRRGCIAFLASSHFGLTSYLDGYTRSWYQSFTHQNYGQSIGTHANYSINYLVNNMNYYDYFVRTHSEQFLLHGDPALKLYSADKPDYVVEDNQVKTDPAVITISNNKFVLSTKIYNIGKAIPDSVPVKIIHQLPSGNTDTLFNGKLANINLADSSLQFTIAIDPPKHKGINKFIINVDGDNLIPEMSEVNNSLVKIVHILDEGISLTYPQNYSIVNSNNFKYYATASTPFSANKQYIIEVDTTALFNSGIKTTKTITASGGLLEFDHSMSYAANKVYYWRVAQLGNAQNLWATASFVYMPTADKGGYNQSHFYQHTQSTNNNISTDSAGFYFPYKTITQNLTIKNGVYPFAGTNDAAFSIARNNAMEPYIKGLCWRASNFTVNVLNPSTLDPLFNSEINTQGRYGSQFICGKPALRYDFCFDQLTAVGRNAAVNFLDTVAKDGDLIVVRSIILNPFGYTKASQWLQDEATYGVGKSIYSVLKKAGFTDIDSINKQRSFTLVYKKNDPSFTPRFIVNKDSLEQTVFDVSFNTIVNNGYTLSPVMGSASKWYKMQWDGKQEYLNSIATLKLIGVKTDGTTDTLKTYTKVEKDNDISDVDAAIYPKLMMYIRHTDTVGSKAFQLNYWRLLADNYPDAAIAPNVKYTFKDTLNVGEPLQFSTAVKNIANANFTDSLAVQLTITDAANNAKVISLPKIKPLTSADTTMVKFDIATENLVGNNTLFLSVNPANLPAEQYMFNNIALKPFYVIGDNKSPILEVTFDGQHILNGDIVSSKPNVKIELKDEAKYLLLNDTSLINIELKLPDGTIKKYKYNTDTVRFIPATQGTNNHAVVEFTPTLLVDGDYELIVTGKDRSQNNAGAIAYRVGFVVKNKAAISNMFNYPNPFTSSTAFVFTLTGSQVPDQLRIQISTVTGKVVKEINKQELGALRVGRNITEYKWDGRDNYGNELANGVYLYRVITSSQGKTLEKFTPNNVDTEKYFNNGYGKMYLMR